MKSAVAAIAKKAGFVGSDGINTWALTTGQNLAGPIGLYCRALLGKGFQGGRANADALSLALGRDPAKVYSDAVAATNLAGFTGPDKVARWAAAVAADSGRIPGKLGLFSAAFAGLVSVSSKRRHKGGPNIAALAAKRFLGQVPRTSKILSRLLALSLTAAAPH